MNTATENKINGLHPSIRSKVREALRLSNLALTGKAQVELAQGTRTWVEQGILYSQGRTRPGLKVTNAKAGDSIHNYGLAVDIFLLIDGKIASWDVKKDWDSDGQSDWMEVVRVFKSQGFSWGGDWRTFKDMPHFEMTSGLSLKQLKGLYEKKAFIPETTFIKLP